MPRSNPRSGFHLWLADFAVAAFLAVVATYFAVEWLVEDACLDRGGVVRTYGADGFCETAAGQEPLSGLVSGSQVLAIWTGLTLVLLLAGRWFIRRRPAPKS